MTAQSANAESAARVRVVVSGRVQGVFFRVSTCERARDLGLTGWVRNLPDGRVEAVAEGPAAAIETFVSYCRQGPPQARVDRVERRDESPSGEFEEFDIR